MLEEKVVFWVKWWIWELALLVITLCQQSIRSCLVKLPPPGAVLPDWPRDVRDWVWGLEGVVLVLRKLNINNHCQGGDVSPHPQCRPPRPRRCNTRTRHHTKAPPAFSVQLLEKNHVQAIRHFPLKAHVTCLDCFRNECCHWFRWCVLKLS